MGIAVVLPGTVDIKDRLIEDLELMKKSGADGLCVAILFPHYGYFFVLKNRGKFEEAPELQINNEIRDAQ
jgi:hypothetical protein